MAAPDGPNGRTHEPNLRELVADLDGLRALMLRQLDDLRELFGMQDKAVRDLLEERDRRYQEKFHAQKELTAQSFASAEKAIQKAETAQADYNVRSNEFRGQLDDQAKLFMPRTESMANHQAVRERTDRDRDETRQLFDSLKTELSDLRESRSQIAGRSEQQGAGRSQSNWVIGVAVVCGLGALNVLLAVANFLSK